MNKLLVPITLSTSLFLACGGTEVLETDESISRARYNDPEDPPDYPDPPEDPTPLPQPPYSPGLAISQRSHNQITVRWTDDSANETATYLERLEPVSGLWTPLRTYGPVAQGDYYHTDTNVSADARYCYRALATNSGGSRSSLTKCAWTRTAVAKPLWMVQLRVGVANVDDAGTDEGLFVQLNSAANNEVPRGNRTFMDYGHDDFEQNSTFTYDLDMGGIGDIFDITRIDLFKNGEDGVCLREFALVVNGVDIFHRFFGNTASTCHWLDVGGGNDTSFSVSHAELRAHPAFTGYVQPPLPWGFTRPDLEKRIEGLIGNLIAGSQLQWGHLHGRAVEISLASPDTFHLDLDLEAAVNNAANPEVDVDLDIRVAFVPRNTTPVTYDLTFSTVNMSVNVDSNWWWEALNYVLDPLCIPIATVVTGDMIWECNHSLESYIENRVRGALKPFEKAFNVGAQSCPPSAFVGGDGSLSFLGCPS
jgi:hypothetical protein